MAQIKVQYFGPIGEGFSENSGYINFSPVTVFIGKQGTGKSTVAKLFSVCSWLEKSFIRGDRDTREYKYDDFLVLLKNQNLEDYITKKTYISYKGLAYSFEINGVGDFKCITEKKTTKQYKRPKIMYVPAERNILSVIPSVRNVKDLPDMLNLFLEEYDNALNILNGKTFSLPVEGFALKYNKELRRVSIVSKDGSSVPMFHSSSGIQSVGPLSLVSTYLSEETRFSIESRIKSLSKTERDLVKDFINKTYKKNSLMAVSLISDFEKFYLSGSFAYVEESNKVLLLSVLQYYFNTCFINIVEEPELNLFPEAQRQVLFSLLEEKNRNESNQLVITTHSPYLLSFLTLAAKGKELLKKKIPAKKISMIVPPKSCVGGESISIYETLDNGKIQMLTPYESLPSDNNILNTTFDECNELFARLLELEDEYKS